MKKFSFKFEAVLKQRKIREEDALRALGDAQRAYQEEVSAKSSLLSILDRSLRRREELGGDAVPVLAFQLEEDYIRGTKQRLVRADQAILRASKAVEKALRAYLNARKQSRTIEILREKAYEQYRREKAKLEQKRQDDLTVMRTRLNLEAM